MNGVANTSKTGDVCNYVKINEIFNITAEKEEVTMEQINPTVTKHSTHTTIKLSIASLLVALIPKGYLVVHT